MGSSRRDMRELPVPVKYAFGKALYRAQNGEKAPNAKPFHIRGGGASVLEVVEDNDGDTFRAVYTVQFAQAVYVLHVFQKKSKHGVATTKQDVDLIYQRLKDAEDDYSRRYARNEG